jgi:hypothetical protein
MAFFQPEIGPGRLAGGSNCASTPSVMTTTSGEPLCVFRRRASSMPPTGFIGCAASTRSGLRLPINARPSAADAADSTATASKNTASQSATAQRDLNSSSTTRIFIRAHCSRAPRSLPFGTEHRTVMENTTRKAG